MAGCITDSMDTSLSELREMVMDREAWHVAIHGVTKSWTWLSNWTELRVLHLEDSEKMEDMATIHAIFKMKKQSCPVWPQKVDVGMIRLSSTYRETWSRQWCPVVACAVLASDELFVTSRVQTEEWRIPSEDDLRAWPGSLTQRVFPMWSPKCLIKEERVELDHGHQVTDKNKWPKVLEHCDEKQHRGQDHLGKMQTCVSEWEASERW